MLNIFLNSKETSNSSSLRNIKATTIEKQIKQSKEKNYCYVFFPGRIASLKTMNNLEKKNYLISIQKDFFDYGSGMLIQW